MESIPFTPLDAPLRAVLREKYIPQVANWFLGSEPESITVQRGNNSWTTAIALEFFNDALQVLKDFPQHQEICAAIAGKRTLVVRWLLSQGREMPVGLSWDGATWDTGVVVRAIATTLPFLTGSERERAEDAVVKSGIWLKSCFDNLRQLKYPYGSADIARILAALMFVFQHEAGLYARIDLTHATSGNTQVPELLQRLAEYLLRSSSIETQASMGEPNQLTFWEDGFNTAEVAEVLASYYRLIAQADSASVSDDSLFKQRAHELRQVLSSAYQWFESKYVPDGIWEAPVNTARILKAYIELPVHAGVVDDSEAFLQPEPHLVFKSLRWLCDRNQTYSDGSFQHSDLLTAFYAPALLNVYRLWEPATRSVVELYDDIVWTSPMRTSEERSQRLALSIQVIELKESIERLVDQQGQLKEMVAAARRSTFRLTGWAAVTLLAIGILLLGSADLGFVSVSFIGDQVGNLLQFGGLVLTVYLALCTAVFGASKLRNQSTVATQRSHPRRTKSSKGA